MANQYTSAAELGMPAKAERSKDAVRAELLCQRLAAFALDQPGEDGQKVELDAVRVQAAKILIDKGKPNLQAIEQVNYDGDEHADPEQLKAKLKAIATANPSLLSEVLAEIAQSKVGDPPLKAVGK